MAYSDTVDRIGNDRIITDYDGFGRRTIVQDTGYEAMRTVYDGFSFEVLREGVTFRDGSLTTKLATGIVRTEERTPGIRYRYLGPESQNGQLQTRRLTETTSSLATRFTGINATLYGNGEAVAVNRLGNAEVRGGASYLGKDVLGSVRSRSNENGQMEDRYEYDAFGKPYKGDLNSGVNLGYTGKPYDTTTGMYNYGYRDYQPEMARFTTIDPIRDGANWFAYVNNDPVNWVDIWGLWPQATEQAINAHKDEKYESGKNDCDIWVEKILNEGGVSLPVSWSSAANTTVPGHIKAT
jgi:RHS repeat-associated protein